MKSRASGRSERHSAAGGADPGGPEPHSAASRHRAKEEEDRGRFPPALGLLEVAVPLWIERVRNLSWEDRMKRRDHCLVGLGIATDAGDALAGVACLATSSAGKPGQVAAAFNALAEALALGALQPGGVTFAGMHFEAADA